MQMLVRNRIDHTGGIKIPSNLWKALNGYFIDGDFLYIGKNNRESLGVFQYGAIIDISREDTQTIERLHKVLSALEINPIDKNSESVQEIIKVHHLLQMPLPIDKIKIIEKSKENAREVLTKIFKIYRLFISKEKDSERFLRIKGRYLTKENNGKVIFFIGHCCLVDVHAKLNNPCTSAYGSIISIPTEDTEIVKWMKKSLEVLGVEYALEEEESFFAHTNFLRYFVNTPYIPKPYKM